MGNADKGPGACLLSLGFPVYARGQGAFFVIAFQDSIKGPPALAVDTSSAPTLCVTSVSSLRLRDRGWGYSYSFAIWTPNSLSLSFHHCKMGITFQIAQGSVKGYRQAQDRINATNGHSYSDHS